MLTKIKMKRKIKRRMQRMREENSEEEERHNTDEVEMDENDEFNGWLTGLSCCLINYTCSYMLT